MNECQETFEILVDVFLHSQDGIIQPQLISIAQVKDMMKELSLPDGLELPPTSSLEFSFLITPITISKQTYLVYTLQVNFLRSTMYQLHKKRPFQFKQQDNIFVYVEAKRDYVFIDAMRQKY